MHRRAPFALDGPGPVFAFVLGLTLPAAAARTVDHYPVANGIGSAAVRLGDGRLDSFRPAPYAALDEGLVTPELCFDAYFAVRTAGTSRWLTEVPVAEVAAVDDTNAVRVVQHEAGLRIETTWWSPFALHAPAVIARVVVTNEGATALTEVAVPTLANFHVGGGSDGTQGERSRYVGAHDAIVETGARGAVVVRALAPSAGHTMTPSNPFPLVRDGLAIPTVDDSGVADDVVHGFVFAPSGGTLAPGASASFGVLVAHAPTADEGDVLAATLSAFVAGRSVDQLLADEVDAAEAAVAAAALPASLSVAERKLAGSSLAFLRAAQVRDEGAGTLRRRPRGQIVASLPPGIWNITWVRDASYAIDGLLAVGKLEEAEAALRFFLNGDAGEYESYVGREYLLSVTRSYGGGREESDHNAGGPNVEWDNFGLFLRSYARALAEGAPLDDGIAVVKEGVADVLLSLVGSDGLLVPDSSIWETHWEPSFESQGRRQYAYSSLVAAAGLRAFGDVLTERGDVTGATYRAAGDALAAAVSTELVDGVGVLAASKEELAAGAAYVDAAVLEAFNRDVLAADGAVAHATLDAMQALRAQTPGYFRNDEGGEYDSKEWLVVDLWLARALRRSGRAEDRAEAERLLAHVTSVGNDNLGQIPELLAAMDAAGKADGAIPMMGFGAGAYLTALVDRAHDDAVAPVDAGPNDDDAGPAHDDAGPAEDDAGVGGEREGDGAPAEGEGERETESCAATTLAPPLALLPAGLVLMRRRRRR